MQILKTSWLKKAQAAIAGALLLVTVSSVAPATALAQTVTAPRIDWVFIDPQTFDPSKEDTQIHWEVSDETAFISVAIYDGSNISTANKVRSLVGAGPAYSVSNPLTWNGQNDAYTDVPAGTYYYYIKLWNTAGTDTWSGPIYVQYDTPPVPPTLAKPEITGVTANKTTIDPTNNESVTVNFNLSEDATVYFQVYNTLPGNNAAIYSTTGQFSKGIKAFSWNGRNSARNIVAEGGYKIYMYASNSAGTGTGVWLANTITVDYADVPPTPAKPEITGVTANKTTIDPTNNESVNVNFNLSEDATVYFNVVKEASTNLVVYSTSGQFSKGNKAVSWNGKDLGGSIVAEGGYKIYLRASNSAGTGTVVWLPYSIYVDYTNPIPPTSAPNISNYYATPSTFDPYDGDRTNIHYTIDKYADVTVQIMDGGTIVKELQNDSPRSQGSYNVYWDGEDRYEDIVDDDTYRFKIIACNTYDNCDTKYGDITVDTNGNNNNSDDLISDVEVNDAIFDPTDNEKAELCFVSEEDNIEFTVDILDGSKVIKTLLNHVEYDSNWRRCVEWNGKDKYNDIVDDDVYQFRIKAEKGNRVEVEYAYTEVDTDGRIIGFPDDNDNCGGFRDVPKSSPFCKAIELMGYRGIFDGYEDGTFRPYAPINRAEATKVILLALDTNILSDDSSNLGFWDVQRKAWYMSYLRTAQRLGIISGYPDGSFKPNANVNRVELLKIFLEANEVNVPYCTTSPYSDTQNTYTNRWYINYVCFAKAYGLMGSDSNGNFNPAQPMTRGDVANLFYAFENRGFYGGNSANYNYGYYNDYYNNYNPYSYSSPGYNYYEPNWGLYNY